MKIYLNKLPNNLLLFRVKQLYELLQTHYNVHCYNFLLFEWRPNPVVKVLDCTPIGPRFITLL